MNDLWKKIQPLRVANGWTIDLNNLYDIELTQENIGWFCGEFLLSGSNHSKKICFDASFEPEGDINGGFVVKFFSMYYDKKLNNFELNKFLGTFETKDKSDFINTIERFMFTLEFPTLIKRTVLD